MMKTLLAMLALLVLAGCDDGSLLDSETVTFNADRVWRMESDGIDLRVYEFTPKMNPDVQCIFVSGSLKGSTVCFSKKK